MNNITTTWKLFFLRCLIALFAVLLTGCDDSDLSTSEIATKKLMAKTWELKSAAVDGVDVSGQFTGLALNFTATGLTVTNENMLWPSGTTWIFADKTATTLIRGNDQLEITILELTHATLKVELTWTKTTFSAGRVHSVSGVYIFVFG